MMIQFPSFPVVFAIVFVLTLIVKHRKKSHAQKLPPGPMKLPLIGNLHQLIIGSSIPHVALERLAGKYGPIMHLQLGEGSAIVISSAEAAEEVLKEHELVFAQRPTFFAFEVGEYGNQGIVFAPHGSFWRQIRKVFIVELLGARQVRSFKALREEEVENLIGSIASSVGSSINLTEKILRTTNSIVSRAAFGKKCRDADEFLAILNEGNKLASGFGMADFFPSLKFVPFEIFGAGTDTSATTVEWAMAEMLRNPAVLEKAQAEVRRVLKGKKNISEEDIHELHYLKLIVKETLRLHPPGALMPRESTEECEINGYNIPAKTKTIINLWAMGRNPKHWDDPNCFKPERFHQSSINYLGTNFEYIPFGAGRRICPGISFAVANMELQLAQLLYHFDWKLSDGIKPEELDMTEESGFTVRKKHALRVIATPALIS
ncbi:hypothetical protein RJ640_013473 [Escallonia rubra]|uniref:Cytochrome P450 n=1 Tax=Escallonia rubra TaxID=112253 RepID=A0AA88UGH3_9ASTE|nr:hypothetical protein RJ640_013473 [Escallonia rubra]